MIYNPKYKKIIVVTNRCYLTLSKYMRSKLLSRSSKIRIYTAIIRSVLTMLTMMYPYEERRDMTTQVRKEDTEKILWKRKNWGLYKDADVVQCVKIDIGGRDTLPGCPKIRCPR